MTAADAESAFNISCGTHQHLQAPQPHQARWEGLQTAQELLGALGAWRALNGEECGCRRCVKCFRGSQTAQEERAEEGIEG